MAFKFALIAALCIAQGFALKPLGKGFGKGPQGPQGPKGPKGPCKHPLSESAEEIPHDFEEAMHEMDEIRDTVSMAAMDAYMKGNELVVIRCFNQERKNYFQLGQKIAGMMRKASEEMAQELGENYAKWAEKAEGPIKTIAMTMRTLPQKMWIHIKNQEFTKAMEVMKESRRIVAENSKILNEIIQEMAEEFPEAAKKAEQMAHEIRETAKEGCKAIAESFHKCVEAGGPNKPIDDSEIEDDLEESPEQ